MKDINKIQSINYNHQVNDTIINNKIQVAQETLPHSPTDREEFQISESPTREVLKDEKKERGFLSRIENLCRDYFKEFFKLQIIFRHNVFNEEEAAEYLRLTDPQGAGKQTTRYHALKSKKLSFVKIGRDGLIFTRTDLDNFINNERIESYREL